MGFPVGMIVLIVVVLIAWGEYKERQGKAAGEEIGEARAGARVRPLIEQECKRRDDYWLNVLRVHSLPAPAPPQPVVLQLGDGLEIRQKPQPRLPKEGK